MPSPEPSPAEPAPLGQEGCATSDGIYLNVTFPGDATAIAAYSTILQYSSAPPLWRGDRCVRVIVCDEIKFRTAIANLGLHGIAIEPL
jgi:hypothetical protein